MAITGFQAWVNSDCTGDFASSVIKPWDDDGPPEGYRLVRLVTDGSFMQTADEVPTMYLHVPSPNGPCIEYGKAVPPPYYRWQKVEPSAFVKATLVPE